MGFLKGVWEHWKQFAHAVGVVQTRGIMILIYGLIAVPTGILMRLTGDRLHIKKPANGNWHPHIDTNHSIDTARSQG